MKKKKSKKKEKSVLVKPSLMKPEQDPEEMSEAPLKPEDELDVIPDEDPFETPTYEPPKPGEGP